MIFFLHFSRCAFHAYADSTYAKHLENGGAQSIYGTIGPAPNSVPVPPMAQMTVVDGAAGNGAGREYQQSVIEVSDDSINSIEKVEEWKVLANGHPHKQRIVPNGATSSSPSRENGKN